MDKRIEVELENLNINAKELLEKYNQGLATLNIESLKEISKIKEVSENEKKEIIKIGNSIANDIGNKVKPTKVIDNLLIDIPKSVTKGENTFTVSAKSHLKDCKIKMFKITIGEDEQIIKTDAADKEYVTVKHFFKKNIGEEEKIEVVAIDELGNVSDKVIKIVKIVKSNPPDKPSVSYPEEVQAGEVFKIKIVNLTNDITYKITKKGKFIFAKAQDIKPNEEITITAPDVKNNTIERFEIVAVNKNGIESDPLIVNIKINAFIIDDSYIEELFDFEKTNSNKGLKCATEVFIDTSPICWHSNRTPINVGNGYIFLDTYDKLLTFSPQIQRVKAILLILEQNSGCYAISAGNLQNYASYDYDWGQTACKVDFPKRTRAMLYFTPTQYSIYTKNSLIKRGNLFFSKHRKQNINYIGHPCKAFFSNTKIYKIIFLNQELTPNELLKISGGLYDV